MIFNAQHLKNVIYYRYFLSEISISWGQCPRVPGENNSLGGLVMLPSNLKTFFQVLRKPATDPDESPGFNNASSLET